MTFKVYYRKYRGDDHFIIYGSLQAMKTDLAHEVDSDFDYINACVINDDGSEDIVYSSVKEILNAK